MTSKCRSTEEYERSIMKKKIITERNEHSKTRYTKFHKTSAINGKLTIRAQMLYIYKKIYINNRMVIMRCRIMYTLIYHEG